MIKVRDIAEAIESFAPLKFQASFDNSGLLVGNMDREVRGVLIAVDLTDEVIAEAIALGADMVVTHHPIVFSPLKRFTGATYVERSVELAIRENIVIYAAHTNLDSAPGGLSWRLGEMFGLSNMSVLELTDTEGGAGFGVIGDVEGERKTEEFIDSVAQKLSHRMVRHSDPVSDRVHRVAICSGSGASMMEAVDRSGADMFLTADLKYNNFFDAQKSFTLVDIGHYESEYCAIDLLFDILSKKITNFALHKSCAGRNPVHYRLYTE